MTKYPILCASRLLDQGYNLKLDTQHCSLSHGDSTAPLLRQRGLFYLAGHQADLIPQGHELQPLTDHDGVMRAVIQPITTDNHLPQHNTIAPLTHTDQGLRRILGGNTDCRQLDCPRKALFTPEDSGRPIPTEQLDDWRQTTVVRTGQEPEILQDSMKQISKTDFHKQLPGDDWVVETRFRRKMNPTQRITGKTTLARQSSSAQPEKQPTTTTTRTSLTMRTPQKSWRPKVQQTQPTSIDTPVSTSKTTGPPAQQEDKQEYRERQEGHWIRHHLVPRTTLLIPADGPGHPPTNSLEPYRTTITNNNFNQVNQYKARTNGPQLVILTYLTHGPD